MLLKKEEEKKKKKKPWLSQKSGRVIVIEFTLMIKNRKEMIIHSENGY